MTEWKPPSHPWERAELEDFELLALKSLSTGTANDGQQRIAIGVILKKLCRVYDMSFRIGRDGARETDFAEGMRSVGSAIMEAVARPMKQSGELKDASRNLDASGPGQPNTASAARRNPKPAGAPERPKT